MRIIFICYRRSDTAGDAGRLVNDLKKIYGKHLVFKDVDSIEPGEAWLKKVEGMIRWSRCVLVLIGPKWVELARHHQESPDAGEDWVKREIELALKHSRKIIPVCIQDTPMPTGNLLPESIRKIAEINAAKLRWDPDYNNDLQVLRRCIGKNIPWDYLIMAVFFIVMVIREIKLKRASSSVHQGRGQ